MGDMILRNVLRAGMLLFIGGILHQSALGQSAVVNPGFESGTAPWAFYSDGAASFAADGAGAGSAHAAHIAITVQGSNVQLYQAGISLEANVQYTISFKAYSNTGHDLSVVVAKHTTPFTNYGLRGQRFDLTTSWNTYSVQFTASGFSGIVTDARLRFWLANDDVSGDVYYIDDVALNKTVTGAVAPGITTQPLSQAVTVGQTATFAVVASGTLPLSYQWQKGAVNISGATATTHTTPVTVIGDNGTTYRCVVTNNVSSATSNAATLTVNAAPPPPSSSLVSDDFRGPVLNTSLWSFVNPVGDGAVSLTGTGTQNARLSISVPAGISHDLWVGSNNSPRLLQSFNNSDFEVETRFEAPMSAQYQMQGIVAQQDNNTFVRFDFVRDASNTRFFCASFSAGTPTVRKDTIIAPGNPLYLRVKRQGNAWTGSFSYNGTVWITAASFSYALTVNTVGPFAGNHGVPASASPAWTALIDYFFNTGSPITPEDGSGTPVAPSIATQPSNQTVTVGQTATFTVVAAGTTPFTYQWQKGAANISGATAATYTTPVTVVGDNGSTYRCVVTNSVSSATSNAATLTVQTTPITLSFAHQIIDSAPPRDPHDKGIGDIDGDGFNDVLAASSTNFTEGLFWYKYPSWTKYNIHTGSFSTSMAVADIDGDGDPDAIIAKGDWYGYTVWVYVNPRPSGNPEVGASWQEVYVGDAQTHDIEVGDINNNGKADIVIRGGNTTLFVQNTLTSWTKAILNTRPFEGTSLADIDRDADLDIAINGYWLENPLPGGNPATAAWTEHLVSSSWLDKIRVHAADLNGDGRQDLLYVPSEYDGGKLAWYESTTPRTGPWTEHTMATGVGYVHTLKTADMDRDGRPDVVTAEMHQSSDPDEVLVYRNTGGGLTWDKVVVATTGSHNAQLGDIGNDSDIDIVGANWDMSAPGGTPIEYWENLGRGTTPVKSLDQWTYIHGDNTRGASIFGSGTFGLGFADLDGDGYQDIASGHYFYRNPGSTMTSTPWPRITLPGNPQTGRALDAFLLFDAEGTGVMNDIIAEDLPSVTWLRANDAQGTSWTARVVAQVPVTVHGNGRTVISAHIVATNTKPDILLSGGDGIYLMQIPSDPAGGSWPIMRITTTTGGEQKAIGTGDLDNDGDLDIAVAAGESQLQVDWWSNPADGTNSWIRHGIGTAVASVKMIQVADVNGDGRRDVIVTEDARPASVYWFEAPVDALGGVWVRHTVAAGLEELDSMSGVDMNNDGMPDIVVGEIFGAKRLIIYENVNNGASWRMHVVDSGKESHNGARVVDLNNDGNPDVVSIAYFAYADLHVWRNDAGLALKVGTNNAMMSRSTVDEDPAVKIPTSYGLRQNYPNPFNPTTTIGFDLPEASFVRLAVFNTLGEQVVVLQEGERPAGYHEVRFDARALSSGVYFYRIAAGPFTAIRKLLLVR